MKEARMLGSYVEYLANQKGLSTLDLSHILGRNEIQAYSFLKGRSYVSFSQISTLAKALDTTVEKLLHGNKEIYNTMVICCEEKFQSQENQEMILDLIDDYLDVVDAIIPQ